MSPKPSIVAKVRTVPPRDAIDYILVQDVSHPQNARLSLLKAGVKISARLAERLEYHGIKEIQVVREASDANGKTIYSAKDRKKVVAKVAKAFDNVREHYQKQQISQETIDTLLEITETVSDQLLTMPDAALAISNLASADEYTHTHSVSVCAIGVIIARAHWEENGWYDPLTNNHVKGDHSSRLQKLAMGLLLHDIGKMFTPLEILNKTGKLTEKEWEVMRRHPEEGAELVDGVVSPWVLGVIRDHHERWNGNGYPAGLKGDEIHEFSRIAAIADVYDAITSERPYKEARPAVDGVNIIRKGRGTDFEETLVDTFLELFFPYPIGTKVQLDNGQEAFVSRIDPEEPYKPYVTVKKRFKTSGSEIQMDFTDKQ